MDAPPALSIATRPKRTSPKNHAQQILEFIIAHATQGCLQTMTLLITYGRFVVTWVAKSVLFFVVMEASFSAFCMLGMTSPGLPIIMCVLIFIATRVTKEAFSNDREDEEVGNQGCIRVTIGERGDVSVVVQQTGAPIELNCAQSGRAMRKQQARRME